MRCGRWTVAGQLLLLLLGCCYHALVHFACLSLFVHSIGRASSQQFNLSDLTSQPSLSSVASPLALLLVSNSLASRPPAHSPTHSYTRPPSSTIGPLSPIRYHFSPWVNSALLAGLLPNASSLAPSSNLSSWVDCGPNPVTDNLNRTEMPPDASVPDSPNGSFRKLSCAERKLLRDLQLQEQLRVELEQRVAEQNAQKLTLVDSIDASDQANQTQPEVPSNQTHIDILQVAPLSQPTVPPQSLPSSTVGPALADQLLHLFQLLSKGQSGQRRLQQQFSRLNQFASWQKEANQNERLQSPNADRLSKLSDDILEWSRNEGQPNDSLQPQSQCLPLLPSSIAEICDEVDQFSSIKYVINSVRRADPRLGTQFQFQRLYAANEQRLKFLLYDYGLAHCSKYSLWSLLSPSARAQLLGLPASFSMHSTVPASNTTSNSSSTANSTATTNTQPVTATGDSSSSSHSPDSSSSSSPYQMRRQCRAVLTELFQLDQIAKQQYCEFDRMLSRYYCKQYSVKSTCTECRVSRFLHF
jgi:hypothetical protein